MPKLVERPSNPSVTSTRRADGYAEMPLKPRLTRIPYAQDYLGVGRSKIYRLIAEGKLRAVKIGSATLIDVKSMDTYIDSLPPM